ncbi:MAG: hypothetical protein IPO41_03545 [Acidobacteria bacterium]|nr:hypothetical protein [Acidobacteriota bacterium]
MNDNDRRRYEMLVRVKQFGIDNAGDFSGIATTKFTEIDAIVGATDSEAAKQQAGFGEAAQQFEVKDSVREDLRDEMSAISRTAKSMEYEFDGIADKFRFQRNMNDVEMLAKARAFVTEATPYNADFIAYGMPTTFAADLTALADAFEASFATTASATAEHVAATAETASKIREGMIAVRTVDGIVQNKYANDPGKLAAWLSAKHVEKAPKKKAPTP